MLKVVKGGWPFRLWLCVAFLFCAAPGLALAQNTGVAEVWGQEDSLWEYVQTGNVEQYLKLWHEDFIGWPCAAGKLHPVGKSDAWPSRIRGQNLGLSYKLHHEGAEDFGEVIVVHYSTKMTYEYPDGRVTGERQLYKFTHSWMKSGSQWQIIGGMCAPVNSS